MQVTAYGFLNLKPDEFWSLSLREYKLMIKGFNRKEDMDWRKLSQLAAWNIQPHVKKTITADKLYNPNAKEQRKTTPEETQEVMEELDDIFGKVS